MSQYATQHRDEDATNGPFDRQAPLATEQQLIATNQLHPTQQSIGMETDYPAIRTDSTLRDQTL